MRHDRTVRRYLALAVVLLPLPAMGAALARRASSTQTLASARIDGDGLRLELDARMRSRIVASLGGAPEVVLGPYTASETLMTSAGEVTDFVLEGREEQAVRDVLGAGRRVVLTGQAAGLRKTLTVSVYDDFPRLALFTVRYTNETPAAVQVKGWTSNRYAL